MFFSPMELHLYSFQIQNSQKLKDDQQLNTKSLLNIKNCHQLKTNEEIPNIANSFVHHKVHRDRVKFVAFDAERQLHINCTKTITFRYGFFIFNDYSDEKTPRDTLETVFYA